MTAAAGIGRRRDPRWLATLGVGLAAAVVAATTAILLAFQGHFTSYEQVTAVVPASATAVPDGAPVEYRNVNVGKVADSGTLRPDGLVAFSLHLKPGQVGHIPATVRATVAPVSIFGNEYLVLEPPPDPGAATLRAGATVPPVDSQVASLQATLGDLDHLLLALHPQELDTALTALADAITGQGASLGQTFVAAHDYLTTMLPLWPTAVSDLQKLAPVATTIAAATPDLTATFGNLIGPNQTVSAAGPQIAQLFSGSASLAGQTADLLGRIQQPFAVLAAASGPFLDDISGASPTELQRLFSGLARWASTWNAAEASGPWLNVTATIQVANPADLALAVLGGPQAASALAAGLGGGMVNPPTYGGGATTAVMAEPAQQQAVASLASVADGGRAPASPAVATLLLSPVLHAAVAHP